MLDTHDGADCAGTISTYGRTEIRLGWSPTKQLSDPARQSPLLCTVGGRE